MEGSYRGLTGYREPPPGQRMKRVRIEQVQLMFPVDSDAEYQWGFHDGTRSEWKPVPGKDLIKAPPGAAAVFWRRCGEAANQRRSAESSPRKNRSTPLPRPAAGGR